MLDHSRLSPEALTYYSSLSMGDQIALAKSNTVFHSLEDLREYRARMSPRDGEVLYQTLPEPSVPSNGLLDELDSE